MTRTHAFLIRSRSLLGVEVARRLNDRQTDRLTKLKHEMRSSLARGKNEIAVWIISLTGSWINRQRSNLIGSSAGPSARINAAI